MSNNREATCAERIGQELKDREAEMKQMLEKANEEGDFEDVYEFAIGINNYKMTTLTLSWGGPADYLDIKHGEEGIISINYRFEDWFDGASKQVEEGSPLWEYAEMMLEVVSA